jgi:hypothetical protein
VDLNTFLTELYVLVDDWYKGEYGAQGRKQVGRKALMSDSEVLTVGLLAQWRIGVAWESERGCVRWMHRHGRDWFPHMLRRSAFNRRVRVLWRCFIRLQQVLGEWLGSQQAQYECVDGLPLIAMSNGQALRESSHWLWESQKGHGGTSGGYFIGDRLLAAVTANGLVSGWLLGNADINERWLLSALLSARAGTAELVAPPVDKRTKRAERPIIPVGHIGALVAAGHNPSRLYLADRGLNSARWRKLWQQRYGAIVLSIPPDNAPERADWSRADCLWLASHRQIVETVFAVLSQVFGIQHLNAHSRWGQYTRLAAKIAAYHLALWFNRGLGRPLLAVQTLLC